VLHNSASPLIATAYEIYHTYALIKFINLAEKILNSPNLFPPCLFLFYLNYCIILYRVENVILLDSLAIMFSVVSTGFFLIAPFLPVEGHLPIGKAFAGMKEVYASMNKVLTANKEGLDKWVLGAFILSSVVALLIFRSVYHRSRPNPGKQQSFLNVGRVGARSEMTEFHRNTPPQLAALFPRT